MADADYTRELEDALLIVWEELPVIETVRLRNEYPEMMAFVAHVHHAVAHEQAMVRRSVWERDVCQVCDPRIDRIDRMNERMATGRIDIDDE